MALFTEIYFRCDLARDIVWISLVRMGRGGGVNLTFYGTWLCHF